MDETEVFLRKYNAKTGNRERQANTFEHNGHKLLFISTNQQHIYINIYIFHKYNVISPTYFDASTSSSNILNLLLAATVTKILKL
jgi:hypothetical protein